MGLFNFLKKNNTKIQTAKKNNDGQAVAMPESEKKYYQSDSYYTSKPFEGTLFESEVITFDERKKTAIPSTNGLFVPEILMLHFCKKYPNPKGSYPGYWWFKYGIRDVGSILNSLVDRGFLSLDEKMEKYVLTALGKTELDENMYIPYMHKHSISTTFTTWDLNILLGINGKDNYKEIIEKKHAEIASENKEKRRVSMLKLQESNPGLYKSIKDQTEQLELFKAADTKYAKEKNLDWIISFWEKVWEDDGPKFEGTYWMFRLPDLYIQAKRYDDALAIITKIENRKESSYSDRAKKYIEKVSEYKAKERPK